MIKKVFSMPHSEAVKIRSRQQKGTMKEIFDDDCCICFDVDEYNNWKPKKAGRKTK